MKKYIIIFSLLAFVFTPAAFAADPAIVLTTPAPSSVLTSIPATATITVSDMIYEGHTCKYNMQDDQGNPIYELEGQSCDSGSYILPKLGDLLSGEKTYYLYAFTDGSPPSHMVSSEVVLTYNPPTPPQPAIVIPTDFVTNFTNVAVDQLQDPGTQLVLALVVGIPLSIWVIKQIISIIKNAKILMEKEED